MLGDGLEFRPVPFDVLGNLSRRFTNAADTGFKESKDWLELYKHASELSWFHFRGVRKQFLHNICKIDAETTAETLSRNRSQ